MLYNSRHNQQREVLFLLFRKNIEPACAYCVRGSAINDTEIVCRRHGIVEPWWHCKRFRYDPYKREPPRPPKLKQVEIEPPHLPDSPTDSLPNRETIQSAENNRA
jgi:hypothetical protein